MPTSKLRFFLTTSVSAVNSLLSFGGSHADRGTKQAVDSSGTRNAYGGAVSPLLASCSGGLPDEGEKHVPSKNPRRRFGALQGSLRRLWACRTALPASEDVHDVRHPGRGRDKMRVSRLAV